MAGKQVLRIETRERLRPGNVRHVAGLVRDPTARPVTEPVIALGGADYAAARKALRNAPRRPGRRPHKAVELVFAGPPPFDGSGGAPWAPEREREWAHGAGEGAGRGGGGGAGGRARPAGRGRDPCRGGGGVLPCGAGAAGRGRGVAEADGVGALPHLGGDGAGGRGGRRGRGARSDQAEHAKADDEQEGRDQADRPSDRPELSAKAGDVGLYGGAEPALELGKVALCVGPELGDVGLRGGLEPVFELGKVGLRGEVGMVGAGCEPELRGERFGLLGLEPGGLEVAGGGEGVEGGGKQGGAPVDMRGAGYPRGVP